MRDVRAKGAASMGLLSTLAPLKASCMSRCAGGSWRHVIRLQGKLITSNHVARPRSMRLPVLPIANNGVLHGAKNGFAVCTAEEYESAWPVGQRWCRSWKRGLARTKP